MCERADWSRLAERRVQLRAECLSYKEGDYQLLKKNLAASTQLLIRCSPVQNLTVVHMLHFVKT
jgi:hypothetical protein